jgi:hypothetical protein
LQQTEEAASWLKDEDNLINGYVDRKQEASNSIWTGETVFQMKRDSPAPT